MKCGVLLAPLLLAPSRPPLPAAARAPVGAIACSAPPSPPPPPSDQLWSSQLQLLLPKLRGRALQKVAGSMPATASVRTLDASLRELEAAGFGPADVLDLARRRPKLVGALATRSPAPLLGVLEETLGIRAESDGVGRLLRAQPAIISLDPPRLIAATLFLQGYVGGASRVGEFVRMHPEALLWRRDGDSPVSEHLRLLGVPESAIKKAGRGFPRLHQLSSADNLARLIEYVTSDLGLSPTALARLIGSYPQLLGLSLDSNVRPTAQFLAAELELDPARILARHPQAFGLSLDSNLRPKAEYLAARGVDVRRAFDGHPALLSLSLDGKIAPALDFLSGPELGLPDVGRAVSSQPALLSLSVDANLRPKLHFLRELGMSDLGRQLGGYPALLTLSVDANLRPTAQALAAAGLLPRNTDGALAVALKPRHLAASLAARVQPRLAFCEAARERRRRQREDAAAEAAEAAAADEAAGIRLSLNLVTIASDAAFAEGVGEPLAEYAAFKRAWTSRRGGGKSLNIPWLPSGMDFEALVLGGGRG